MKNKIKKSLISIILSVICGTVCGKYLYNIYFEQSDLIFENNKVYLIQNGTYSSYDKMRTSTLGYDYVFYEDEGSYNSIIGITKNKKNIQKIVNTYNTEVVISEYYLDDKEMNEIIKINDKKLAETEDFDEIKNIIKIMLNYYKETDFKLTKVY